MTKTTSSKPRTKKAALAPLPGAESVRLGKTSDDFYVVQIDEGKWEFQNEADALAWANGLRDVHDVAHKRLTPAPSWGEPGDVPTEVPGVKRSTCEDGWIGIVVGSTGYLAFEREADARATLEWLLAFYQRHAKLSSSN